MSHWQKYLAVGLAVYVLWRNFAKALLCLFPRLMRARPREHLARPPVNQALFEQMEEELAELGFKRLGVHLEQAPLQQANLVYNLVNEPEHTWACATVRKNIANLYFLSVFENHGLVLTADYPRKSIDCPGICLVGALLGAEPKNLFAAHLRRREQMLAAGGVPGADLSLDSRIEAANTWFAGHGKTELRLRYLANFLLSATVMVFMAVLLYARLHG